MANLYGYTLTVMLVRFWWELTVSYILTKGSREEELSDTRYKLDKAEEKLSKIEDKLQESESNLLRLIQAKHDIKFELQDCLRTQDNLRNIYGNSFCLFRYSVSDTSRANLDKNEIIQSSVSRGK